MRYLEPKLREVDRWLASSNETTNLTYNLTALNRRYLAAFVADVTSITYEDADGFLRELEDDADLARHVVQTTLASDRADADADARYGRRLAWYGMVRAVKPGLVVETGVEKGLGACVLAAAVLRNREDGVDGAYLGIDIDEDCGYLFGGKYAQAGSIVIGDAIETIAALNQTVGVYVSDSDHDTAYEAGEYRTIAPHLAECALVIADNAHASPALLEFARQTGRSYAFFREEPEEHWYPGAGVGVAFSRTKTQPRS